MTRRTVFRLEGRPERARTYLVAASGITAGALAFGIVRLVFGPTAGCPGSMASPMTVSDPIPVVGTATDGPRPADPAGLALASSSASWSAGSCALGAARRPCPPVPGPGRRDHDRLVTATISSPIAAGVFGGVTGGGTDLLVAMFRALGLGSSRRPSPRASPATRSTRR